MISFLHFGKIAHNSNCHVRLVAAFMLKVPFYMVLIAEELEENPFNTNLLSIRNVELSNSFKSLELDTDSSRGSGESLDSLASSLVDDQSLVRR